MCANSSNLGASRLKTEYVSKRFGYQGQPYDENRFAFDAELIENVIVKMKRGKAAGLDGITYEHLLFSHPLLPGILAKLFNFMIRIGYVPDSFGQSYTCLLYTSPSPRDRQKSRMPSSA